MSDIERRVVLGVDVGGTNTDAVIVQLNTSPPRVLSSAKSPTTHDVTTGIQRAIANAILEAQPCSANPLNVTQVNIGTTHFVNAIVQRKSLAKVAVIRLCGPASRFVPPFSDFEDKLRTCIDGGVFMVNGGYEFDGRAICDVSRSEIQDCIQICVKNNIKNVVVSGIFSPIRSKQEEEVRRMIYDIDSDVSVTLSGEIGQLGLLERENAAILNESLKPLSKETLDGFRTAIHDLGLTCPFFLTQNDGTIVSEALALRHPVRTFASGPTNSMRGAAFLSGVKDAIVIDIGGTTTDVGILRNGFPREASSEVKIGGIRTNFRMPDVLSFGLGGGSYVSVDPLNVGPRSAGYNLMNEALIFGTDGDMKNRRLTATDVAVSAKLCQLGNPGYVSHIDPNPVIERIREMIEVAVDQMKTSADALPVILVGGGTILLDLSKGLRGASNVLKPRFSDVANAVGAALSQVSGSVDMVYSIMDYLDQQELATAIQSQLEELGEQASQERKDTKEKEVRKTFFEKARDLVLAEAETSAVNVAVESGAVRENIELVEKSDTPLSYLPGNATRVQVKVVGELSAEVTASSVINEFAMPEYLKRKDESDVEIMPEKQKSTATGASLDDNAALGYEEMTDPHIDTSTGEWILSTWDVECIGLGAGILGCGGGGSPYLGRLLAKMAIKQGKTIRVITPEELLRVSKRKQEVSGKTGVVVPVAMMGAPLIMTEKLVSGETTKSLACLQDLYIAGYRDGELPNPIDEVHVGNDVTYIENYSPIVSSSTSDIGLGDREIIALVSAEIGGLNCIEPLMVSAELGLPVLDCDGMGRAFPELQMYTPLIYGAKPHPSTLADEKGRKDVVLKANSAKALENHFRKVVVEMGCSAGVTISSLRISDELDKLVPYSLSRTWRLGRAVLMSRRENSSPIEAVRKEASGILIITGKITDIRRETTGGFNRGFLKIVGTNNFSGKNALIEFQNENLIARISSRPCASEDMEVVAIVPDLITVLDIDTGEPIPTENVRYGQRVAALTLPSHHLLRTPQALEFVGPGAFGYSDIVFTPCGPPQDTEPVGPR